MYADEPKAMREEHSSVLPSADACSKRGEACRCAEAAPSQDTSCPAKTHHRPCRHGKRPYSASSARYVNTMLPYTLDGPRFLTLHPLCVLRPCRLLSLQKEWAGEVTAMKELQQATLELTRRRNDVYEKLREGSPKKAKKHEQLQSATQGLKFGLLEPWQPYHHNAGRSSRRTAFVSDYNGVLYTGPERLSNSKSAPPKQAAGGQDMRASTDTIADVAEGTSASGAPRNARTSGIHSAVTGKLLPHRMPAAGMPSIRPTSAFANLSCRRRRWYSDYSGKRILVDVTDMPVVSNEG